MSLSGCPELAPAELRDFGYLQEVNRRFFHPLGLALAVDGERLFVLDSRDDPEGVNFAELDRAKVDRVALEEARRVTDRDVALGYWVQPLPPSS